MKYAVETGLWCRDIRIYIPNYIKIDSAIQKFIGG
jgi:hypothetical protein